MTLQEIQYKAQGIIHKWRDDDSAPYIEFVEELAHMIVPEPSEDLEEAAEEYADKHGFRVPYDGSDNFYDDVDVKASKEGFIAGYNLCKEQMMKEAVEYEVWDFSVEAYPHVNIPLDNKQYRSGDKVRVIVLPKED